MPKQKLNRNVNIGFRVTEEERAQVAARMEECGIRSIRAFLLKMAMNGYIINLDLSEVREMARELRAVGNNVNQMARRANETGSIYTTDIEDIRARLDGLWERLDNILKALSKI